MSAYGRPANILVRHSRNKINGITAALTEVEAQRVVGIKAEGSRGVFVVATPFFVKGLELAPPDAAYGSRRSTMLRGVRVRTDIVDADVSDIAAVFGVPKGHLKCVTPSYTAARPFMLVPDQPVRTEED